MLHHSFIRLMSPRSRVGASCDTTTKEREHDDKHEEEEPRRREHLSHHQSQSTYFQEYEE